MARLPATVGQEGGGAGTGVGVGAAVLFHHARMRGAGLRMYIDPATVIVAKRPISIARLTSSSSGSSGKIDRKNSMMLVPRDGYYKVEILAVSIWRKMVGCAMSKRSKSKSTRVQLLSSVNGKCEGGNNSHGYSSFTNNGAEFRTCSSDDNKRSRVDITNLKLSRSLRC